MLCLNRERYGLALVLEPRNLSIANDNNWKFLKVKQLDKMQ